MNDGEASASRESEPAEKRREKSAHRFSSRTKGSPEADNACIGESW